MTSRPTRRADDEPAFARPRAVSQTEWDAALALTPDGGQSDDEDAPEGWPQAPQSFWYRRHDEFTDPPPSATGGGNADADHDNQP